MCPYMCSYMCPYIYQECYAHILAAAAYVVAAGNSPTVATRWCCDAGLFCLYARSLLSLYQVPFVSIPDLFCLTALLWPLGGAVMPLPLQPL